MTARGESTPYTSVAANGEMGADRNERYRAWGRRARVSKFTLVEANFELSTW